MLSRVADALYWTGCEVERTGAVARLLDVTTSIALDGALNNGAGWRHVWQPVLEIATEADRFGTSDGPMDVTGVTHHLAFDPHNPDAIVGCAERARERMRTVRSRLPTELFEAVSRLESSVREWNVQRLSTEGTYTFCHEVRDGVSRVDGVVARYVRRDEHWQLLRLGRHLERARWTTRLVAAHLGVLSPVGIGDWRLMLRAASSYEAYVRVALAGPDSRAAVAFLLADSELPSSVTLCLDEIASAAAFLDKAGIGPPAGEMSSLIVGAREAASHAARQDPSPVWVNALRLRLDDLNATIANALIPISDRSGGPLYAQAVRQAQN